MTNKNIGRGSMKLKESLNIEEGLTAYIRNKETGEVRKLILKKPYSKYTLWEKFLKWIGRDPYPGTMTSWGLEQVAKRYANVSGAEYIDQVAAYDGSTWYKKTVTPTVSNATITIKNDTDPFSGGTLYTQVGLFNSSGSSAHNTVAVSIDLTDSSTIEWWVQFELTFQGA